MVFYGIVIVSVIVFTIWFVRTPTFRHIRQGRGKIPGQDASHAEPYYDNSQRYFRKPD
jgi:hypothetical protein